jgi:DNA ligase-1
MLACSESAHNFFDDLRFPLLASPKIDGIRATVRGGVVYARSNKPFPNAGVQAKFGHLEHFDGEFVLGDPTRHDLCRATGGVTNSHGKLVDELTLYAFDHVMDTSLPFAHRNDLITPDPNVVKVEQMWCKNMRDLIKYEEVCLNLGYEGVITRAPDSPYKCGRSTAKEQFLLKLKRFTDAEFEVIGFEERMKNNNEKTVNELGRGQRSSHAANKSGRGDLGALVCQGDGFTFNVGTGFSDPERAEIWGNQAAHKGRLAKVKYFAIGMKDAPRHPVFLGWRDRIDT